jgi:guanine nucleotide exchange factor synembryn
MADNALKETATLLFNILYFDSSLQACFYNVEDPLFSIINTVSEPQSLQQPLTAVIDALMGLDETFTAWTTAAYPPSNPTTSSSKILAILNSSIKKIPERDLETQALRLITLLLKFYTAAPDVTKSFLKKNLLPSDSDRKHVLGSSTTSSSSLSAELLRLTMSPSAPTLRDCIGHLLYELCDKDPAVLVDKIGYGLASGYLMRQGITLPEAHMGAAKEFSAGGVEINPITGQRRDAEPVIEEKPMTDEEKEIEAEKLFVLFERYVLDNLSLFRWMFETLIDSSRRLNRTGVMKVENPVRQAMEQGKIEELPDDPPEERKKKEN